MPKFAYSAIDASGAELISLPTTIAVISSVPLAPFACATATAAGLHHLHVPTRSWPFPEEVEAFLASLDSAERPVLVHCQHGEGRSVMMCAMHRVANEGWSNRRAFEGTCRLPDSIKFLNDWFPSLRRFNPAHPKGKFVLSYRPKHTKQAAAADDDPAPLGATPR